MNNRERIINTVLGRDVDRLRFIDYPVKDRDDWERLKRERLNPLSPDRFPTGWGEVARQCNEGSHAIQLGWFPNGLFGNPQNTDIMAK